MITRTNVRRSAAVLLVAGAAAGATYLTAGTAGAGRTRASRQLTGLAPYSQAARDNPAT